MNPITTCADCGLVATHGTIMLVLQAPRGAWALCSSCYAVSLKEAATDRKDLEAKLARLLQRDTKPKARVGSHG